MAKHTVKPKKHKISPLFLAMIVGVVVCASLALTWMIIKEVYSANMKDVRESKTTVVINTEHAPSDLVSALLAEKPGCEKVSDSGKNIVYIVREKSGVALVHYGCALDSYMFYKKEDGEWKGINPTNQFVFAIPLCSHVERYSIPASVMPRCYEDTITAGLGVKLPNTVANPVH